jgi:hypothetical protein
VDVSFTGERIQSEVTVQRENVLADTVSDHMPEISLPSEGPTWGGVSEMLEDKEVMSSEDAKQAAPKSKQQVLPKLEEEKKAFFCIFTALVCQFFLII